MGHANLNSFRTQGENSRVGRIWQLVNEDRHSPEFERRGSLMFTVSASFLMAGVALAAAAQASPRRRSVLEWAGGTLLIAGLSLLGAGLRLFR